MKQAVNYIGWNSHEALWVLDQGSDYPRLVWENKPGMLITANSFNEFVPGNGTFTDPYRIISAEQLNKIGLFPDVWNLHFILEADIDLDGITGVEWNRIGSYYQMPFSGTFDGQGYIIRNLTYETSGRDCHVGLFGYVSDGTIKNTGLETVVISSGGDCLGTIAGQMNEGVIFNSYGMGLSIGGITVTIWADWLEGLVVL